MRARRKAPEERRRKEWRSRDDKRKVQGKQGKRQTEKEGWKVIIGKGKKRRARKVGEGRKKEAKLVSFKCRPGSQDRHYIVFVERWPSDWLGLDGEARLTK